MQQAADFITADFLYMFRASSAHHQEYKILTRQPPVKVVTYLVTPGGCIRSVQFSFDVLSVVRGLLEKYPTFGREKETGLLGALDT